MVAAAWAGPHDPLHSEVPRDLVVSWPPSDADHLLVTAAQMDDLEKQLFNNGMPVAALMEKVGQGMVRWFLDQPGLLDQGALVLVGPGHNGGDGLVVARELHLAGVQVSLWSPLPIRKSLTAQHWTHACWLGLPQLSDPPDPDDGALWIEALFGLGQTRPLPDSLAALFRHRQIKQPGRLVSLDLPAGLCSDSGRLLQADAAVAATTLSVGLIKQGLVQDLALGHVGQIERVDLGLQAPLLASLGESQPRLIKPADLLTLPCPQPQLTAMKYQRGRVLVIAGSDQYRGAARIAIQGALASGAGSVQAAVPAAVAERLWELEPELIVAASLASSAEASLCLEPWLSSHDLRRLDAVVCGPGLGQSQESWATESAPLRDFPGLLVLDADGLNRLSCCPEGWRWLQQRQGPTWITPHASEFARLFPHLRDLAPLQAAAAAASQSGATVLLKGAHSVLADASGRQWQLSETAPWVARTGLGDLLAGYLGGWGAMALAVEGECRSEACAAAMFLHAEAGKQCRSGSSATEISRVLSKLTLERQRNLYEEMHTGGR